MLKNHFEKLIKKGRRIDEIPRPFFLPQGAWVSSVFRFAPRLLAVLTVLALAVELIYHTLEFTAES